ncbi:hypothetical protein HDU98_009866 [Podochytrium sp. JEL0797]|nr:hypothetical protein HDU98_009866 [Podochytrium sp. JEL0797]
MNKASSISGGSYSSSRGGNSQTASATFTASAKISASGSATINDDGTYTILFYGLKPSTSITLALTATTDFTNVKTSFVCDYPLSITDLTTLATFTADQYGTISTSSNVGEGTGFVQALSGLGLVVLPDQVQCPGGVPIAAAPIIIRSSSSSSSSSSEKSSLLSSTKSNVPDPAKFSASDLSSKFAQTGSNTPISGSISKQASKATSSSSSDASFTLVTAQFPQFSKVIGTVVIHPATGIVAASLSGLIPKSTVTVAVTDLSGFRTSFTCDYCIF